MRRKPLWLLFVGSIIVVVGILLQAFSIVAFVRGAGGGALDMHRAVGDVVHLGELFIVIGAIWRWWGGWTEVLLALGFLVVSVLQLVFIGDIDEPGGWVNGLHGFFAIVLLVAALLYGMVAARDLGIGRFAQRT